MLHQPPNQCQYFTPNGPNFNPFHLVPVNTICCYPNDLLYRTQHNTQQHYSSVQHTALRHFTTSQMVTYIQIFTLPMLLHIPLNINALQIFPLTLHTDSKYKVQPIFVLS
jgi:hypothetical protein